MFAAHFLPNTTCDFVGEILHDDGERLRVQVVDAVLLTGSGYWQLSDEVRDLAKLECRVFVTKQAAADVCYQANLAIR